MQNKIELLDNGIIYIQKIGPQSSEATAELFQKMEELAAGLRRQKRPVLVLTNSELEGKMDMDARKLASTYGAKLDFDRSAAFGHSDYLRTVRHLMITATGMHAKIANFASRSEAEEWLFVKNDG